jgi:hypothetical protein
MNAKFWISALFMFILAFALSFLVHSVLLYNDYMQCRAGCVRKPKCNP